MGGVRPKPKIEREKSAFVRAAHQHHRAERRLFSRTQPSNSGERPGAQLHGTELDAALSGLTAATGLPNAFYGWHSESDRSGYQVKLETRRINEIVLRPSFFYQLSGNEPSRANVRVSGSAVRKDAYKSRFLGAVSLGSNPCVFFEYYHPFGGSPYFIAPGLALERAHFSQYSGDRPHRRNANKVCGIALLRDRDMATASASRWARGPDWIATVPP